MAVLDNIKMKPKLIGLFLAVGLLPLVIATALAVWRSSDAMQQQSFEKLSAVEQIKKNQIETYFSERRGDMSVLAATVQSLEQEGFAKLAAVQENKSKHLEDYYAMMQAQLRALKDDPYMLQAMIEFDQAFEAAGDRVNTTEWRALANTYDQRLQYIANDNGWNDIFLIHDDGDIVYTLRRESDLGMVIPDSALKDSGLGKAFQQAQSMGAEEIAVADFSPYAPSDNEVTAFMMAQMRDMTGTLRGYIAFQMPTAKINEIVQDRTGLGTTGETYLVGQVNGVTSYRSDRIVKTGKIGDPRSGEYIDNALNGLSGRETKIGSTGDLELTAYQPLHLDGLNWAMYTTIAVEEVIVPILEEDKDFFSKYIEQYGYYDLFLIDPRGYVFYTVMQEADYETNMVDGQYSSSNLGRLVRQVLETKQFAIADFEPYAPSEDAQAAFIGQPVLDGSGEVELVVALQLPYEHIDSIMHEKTGMGETGETYLVGQHNGVTAFRSDMTTMGSGEYIIGYEVHTSYIDDALAGNAGQTTANDTEGNKVMVVYDPLNIQGLNWAIISKVHEQEMMQPVNELRNILIIVAVVIAVIVTAVALFFATSLANPIQLITAGAERLAVGDAKLTGMDWGQIERINARGDELGNIGKAFANLIDYFTHGAETMQHIAEGDLSINIQPRSDVDLMGNAMVTMRQSLQAMTESVNQLIEAAVAGQLDARADASKFTGEYYSIVQGINDTLDAVIGPLNVAAEYVDRISKGDIPEIITDEYQGDFNEIKLNLNLCIEAINGLIHEAGRLTNAAIAGQLDTRGDPSQFQGAYADIVRGVNGTLDAVIGPLNVAAEYVDRISKGDLPDLITDKYQGDFNEIKNNLNLLITTLNLFIQELDKMNRDQAAGDIDAEVEVSHFTGAYRDIAQGLNEQVFEHIRIKKRIVEVVGRYGEGDFTAEMDRLPGKKAFINERLDLVRDTLRNLVNTVNALSRAAVAGELSARADTSSFKGDWKTLVQGMNETLDAVIGPLNVAAEYVSQIVQGEVPEPIATQYQGDYEVFKNNLNTLSASLRDMLGSIQEAANDLSTASAQILAATTQQSAGASEQSASITQTTTTVDEVKSISEQAIVRSQEVADSSQRTVEVSRSGRTSVEETIDSMALIKERVENIAENILALSDKTQQIGEITATVNDIASQSNMLALNASVEAARAGEHGKGFAVVAAEVRSLAEQSKQATAQVRAILTDIQNAITASVMVTEEGAKAVDQGVQRAAQAREAIEQLSSVIMESAQVAGQVVAGGQQQASGVEQIALAMQNIHQAMQQSLSSTRQAENAAQNLNELATSLTQTVQQYELNGDGNGHKD